MKALITDVYNTATKWLVRDYVGGISGKNTNMINFVYNAGEVSGRGFIVGGWLVRGQQVF